MYMFILYLAMVFKLSWDNLCKLAEPELNSKIFSKINLGAGGVAQVVEYLPSKCEALSSNSNTTKK
jgi:hypothetical protein